MQLCRYMIYLRMVVLNSKNLQGKLWLLGLKNVFVTTIALSCNWCLYEILRENMLLKD